MRKSEAARIVARARGLIGVRFRAQGRDPAAGLDCIGLVAAAAGIADPPSGYALRGGSAEVLAKGLRAAGFRPVRAMEAGDVLTLRTGPEQLHLGIWTGDGLIHADAGLRRIVERPGELLWPVLGVWRLWRGRR
ncbi:MAG: peptidoglycan endopeptidase [Sphingomonas sp.]|nr:peptidoglycan endopeptidase [Sphingomonas sp.]